MALTLTNTSDEGLVFEAAYDGSGVVAKIVLLISPVKNPSSSDGTVYGGHHQVTARKDRQEIIDGKARFNLINDLSKIYGSSYAERAKDGSGQDISPPLSNWLHNDALVAVTCTAFAANGTVLGMTRNITKHTGDPMDRDTLNQDGIALAGYKLSQKSIPVIQDDDNFVVIEKDNEIDVTFDVLTDGPNDTKNLLPHPNNNSKASVTFMLQDQSGVITSHIVDGTYVAHDGGEAYLDREDGKVLWRIQAKLKGRTDPDDLNSPFKVVNGIRYEMTVTVESATGISDNAPPVPKLVIPSNEPTAPTIVKVYTNLTGDRKVLKDDVTWNGSANVDLDNMKTPNEDEDIVCKLELSYADTDGFYEPDLHDTIVYWGVNGLEAQWGPSGNQVFVEDTDDFLNADGGPDPSYGLYQHITPDQFVNDGSTSVPGKRGTTTLNILRKWFTDASGSKKTKISLKSFIEQRPKVKKGDQAPVRRVSNPSAVKDAYLIDAESIVFDSTNSGIAVGELGAEVHSSDQIVGGKGIKCLEVTSSLDKAKVVDLWAGGNIQTTPNGRNPVSGDQTFTIFGAAQVDVEDAGLNGSWLLSNTAGPLQTTGTLKIVTDNSNNLVGRMEDASGILKKASFTEIEQGNGLNGNEFEVTLSFVDPNDEDTQYESKPTFKRTRKAKVYAFKNPTLAEVMDTTTIRRTPIKAELPPICKQVSKTSRTDSDYVSGAACIEKDTGWQLKGYKFDVYEQGGAGLDASRVVQDKMISVSQATNSVNDTSGSDLALPNNTDSSYNHIPGAYDCAFSANFILPSIAKPYWGPEEGGLYNDSLYPSDYSSGLYGGIRQDANNGDTSGNVYYFNGVSQTAQCPLNETNYFIPPEITDARIVKTNIGGKHTEVMLIEGDTGGTYINTYESTANVVDQLANAAQITVTVSTDELSNLIGEGEDESLAVPMNASMALDAREKLIALRERGAVGADDPWLFSFLIQHNDADGVLTAIDDSINAEVLLTTNDSTRVILPHPRPVLSAVNATASSLNSLGAAEVVTTVSELNRETKLYLADAVLEALDGSGIVTLVSTLDNDTKNALRDAL